MDKNFKKLQKKWYDKIQKRGFKDIEHQGRYGEYYLERELYSNYATTTINAKYTFYARLTNFLTHNPYYPYKASLMWERWALEMYANGASYREIVDYFKKNKHLCMVKMHLPTLFYILKKHIAYALAWNKQNEEGV